MAQSWYWKSIIKHLNYKRICVLCESYELDHHKMVHISDKVGKYIFKYILQIEILIAGCEFLLTFVMK